jgi:hypothetical protein
MTRILPGEAAEICVAVTHVCLRRTRLLLTLFDGDRDLDDQQLSVEVVHIYLS